jgi:hypothetical protein
MAKKKFIKKMSHVDLASTETELNMLKVEIDSLIERVGILHHKRKMLLSILREYNWITYDQEREEIEQSLDRRIEEVKEKKVVLNEAFKKRLDKSNIGESSNVFEQIVEDYQLRPLLNLVNGMYDETDPVILRMKKIYKFLKYNRKEIEKVYKKISSPELSKQEEFKIVAKQLKYWINLDRGTEKRILEFDIMDIPTGEI